MTLSADFDHQEMLFSSMHRFENRVITHRHHTGCSFGELRVWKLLTYKRIHMALACQP